MTGNSKAIGVAYSDQNLTGSTLTNCVLAGSTGCFGNTFYVNETTGNDVFPGTLAQPFATITQALSQCVDNHGDTIYLMGSVHLTATLTWNKAGTNLIGELAPSNNGRSRISATGATAFSPLVNVTKGGCAFVGIGAFHGGFTGATGSQVCWNDAGGRNYYKYVQFLGGGDATTAALAGMRSLTITGVGENLFEDCTIGLDTVVRATNANASLEFLSGTVRNVFKKCIFESYCTAAGDTHVYVAANGMDRYAMFQACIFHNFGGTSLTAAMSNAGGSPGGDLVVSPDCISIGATAIAASGNVYVGQISAAGATTTNIGILAT